MNRRMKYGGIVLLIAIFMLWGCGSAKALLADKINAAEIDRIQIVLSMGNPVYGAASKIITNRKEIQKMVEAFNHATRGKVVKEGDIGIAFPSSYLFSRDGVVRYEFSFNGNDTQRIWLDGQYYSVEYADDTPFELYQASGAEEIIVDKSLGGKGNIYLPPFSVHLLSSN